MTHFQEVKEKNFFMANGKKPCLKQGLTPFPFQTA